MYGTKDDPAGVLAATNRDEAKAALLYFEAQGHSISSELMGHYYANQGHAYGLGQDGRINNCYGP